MKTIELVQGSPEWHAHRATHFNASDAPAMLGCSKYKTRAQLLHELKTGIVPEADAATQRRFDAGHRFEELARPLGAKIIGEPLYPSVGTEGELSASFDGLTMDESIGFEHKTLNDELRAVMTTMDGAALPLQYRVQMEQQCLVSGCEKVLFMATKWDGDELVERREAWYRPDPELRAQIIAGWAQFAVDLAAYVPAAPAAPAPTAKAREALPALVFEAKGEITSSNLDAYKAHALDVLCSIPVALETDQQFVDAKEDAKFCRDVQAAMEQAKAACLGRMESVDQAIKAMEHIAEVARRKALDLENAVEAEEKRRKQKMQTDAIALLKVHVEALNTRIGKPYMPAIAADFAAAIKNKRSVASMQDAIDTTLSRAKIAASEVADRIQINLTTLREHAADLAFLFPDTQLIVQKAPDDLTALVKTRIADHQAAEERKRALAAATTPAPAPAAPPATATAPVAAPTPAPTVIAMPTRGAAVPTSAPTLRLGLLNDRLAPLQITADGLAALGFKGMRERGAVLFHEADYPHILAALAAHVQAIQAKQAA